eukprot:gnl/Hemi2/21812_TR7284_c0_g1_i1.p1 gnl/Hemi2/21812_TR7284_c0_g1~~gnl/Hemi2/21812_TR7284_c0_g1_i1.p1  ORF type:complete len:383 (-),score=68.12 gnl/Hemi2/21812_TR7284_c0_g1_i1:80-1228(-)
MSLCGCAGWWFRTPSGGTPRSEADASKAGGESVAGGRGGGGGGLAEKPSLSQEDRAALWEQHLAQRASTSCVSNEMFAAVAEHILTKPQLCGKLSTMLGSRELRRLLRAGSIPSSVRGRVWARAIGNALQICPELFNLLVEQAEVAMASSAAAEALGKDAFSLEMMICIDKDLPRTFPFLGLFGPGEPRHDALATVLRAFVLYQPDVGYLSGMSFVAGTLLLFMDTYSAFVCFANLYASRPFMNIMTRELDRYLAVFSVLLREQLPDIFELLSKLEVTPSMYLSCLFLTLYTIKFPLELACRIWDNYFLTGDAYLFQAALGFLKFISKELLSATSFEQAAQLLFRAPTGLDDAAFFEATESVPVSQQRFEQLLRETTGAEAM